MEPGSERWSRRRSERGKRALAFDFIGNEREVEEVLYGYGNLATDDGEHAPNELQADFTKDLWRVWNAGLALQRQVNTLRVSMG